MYVQYDYPHVPAHVTVRNSIFSSRGAEAPIFVAPTSVLVAEFNLFFFPQDNILITHGEQSYTCANLTSLGVGNQCGDPLFTCPAWGETGDYHLRPSSPAIDAGTDEDVPKVDLENRSRDLHPDLGCYAFTP